MYIIPANTHAREIHITVQIKACLNTDAFCSLIAKEVESESSAVEMDLGFDVWFDRLPKSLSNSIFLYLSTSLFEGLPFLFILP